MSRCAVWELCAPSLASSGMELPGHKRMPSLRGIVPTPCCWAHKDFAELDSGSSTDRPCY